jgi:hypothetical protein
VVKNKVFPLVQMADGSTYQVKNLLGYRDNDNAKLNKSNKASAKYVTRGLSLAPANASGHEVCASRSPGCTQACIFTSGHARIFKHINRARIAKTRLFFQQRDVFLSMLNQEIKYWKRYAERKGKKLAIRLNVFSDILWEKLVPELFTSFADVQYYDYTKHAKRMAAFELSREHKDSVFFPLNYHLTFSRSETNIKEFTTVCTYKYSNATVVFNSKDLPKMYAGRKVINGDMTDLRFLDKVGVIVGLYAKGKGKVDSSGFVVPTEIV